MVLELPYNRKIWRRISLSSINQVVRTLMTPAHEITRMASVRRNTSLFSQDQDAHSLFVIDDGLVKLTRTNDDGNHIILAMCGSGDIVGEEALGGASSKYATDAEVISPSNLYRIPRETLIHLLQQEPEFAHQLIQFLLHRRQTYAKKVELLCFNDVKYRILFYLVELTNLVRPEPGSTGCHVPITQAELANLVGATRETTSTALNQLERRGLVTLSRRLLTIPSPSLLRSVASQVFEAQATSARAS
jgi:CRP/FNR family cyclic AMP-dependent transcriptional regulator